MTASASKGGKLIALTFDDGPGPYTQELLDGLAKRGVKATFFVQGQRAETYGNTIRRIYADGHQLASHTYNHPQLTTLSDADVRRQVNTTESIINAQLGKNFHYILRPPYGDCNSHTLSIINTPAILWSIDPLDWKYHNSATVYNNIVSAAFDGAIILAHDIHYTTLNGAFWAIDELLAQGYEFVTVNELFRRRGRTLTSGASYSSSKPNGTDLGPVAEPQIATEPTYGGYRVRMTAEAGTKIYYTTDGTNPAVSGTVYTGEFTALAGQTVKAVAAYDLNGSRSAVAEKKLDGRQVAEPIVAVENGKVIFTNPNAEGDVCYTTDGSAVTQTANIYVEPFACYDGALRYRVMGMGIGSQEKTIYVTKNGNLFWDVPTEQWYAETADLSALYGLFTGVDTYTFAPEAEVTRGMFVTVLSRLAEKLGKSVTPTGSSSFRDVPAAQYYAEPIAWAAENGIAKGYDDGTFRPEQTVSREEMCVLLDRMLTFLGVQPTGTAKTFADGAKIGAWARESVAHMSAMGIVNGRENNTFVPQGTATRAEAATVLLRLYRLTQ